MKNSELIGVNHDVLSEALRVIDSQVPNSRNGLPEALFLLVSRMTPMVNVDLLIVNQQNEKLLTWRHDDFYGPGWHIPGGIIRFKETMAERLKKVALKEIGCEAEAIGDPLRVTEIFSQERDIRGHFISHLFKSRLLGAPDPSRKADINSPRQGDWTWFRTAPNNLIPQHRRFAELINEVCY